MATPIDIADLLTWSFRDQAVETAAAAHPDAVTVYWAVLALPAPHANAVSRFARAGHRPDWQPAGGPVVSLAEVRASRRAYTDWVRAMVVLQRTLDGTLTAFRVTGPSFEQEPWRRVRRRA